MAINFPGSPVLDQTYTADNQTWKWNGEAWIPQGAGTTKTLVIGDPYFLMPNQAISGQNVVLKAKASSLLADTTIASFRLTTPDGATTSVLATGGEASTTFTASGALGTELIVKAQAVDTLGNLSRETSYLVTIGTSFVDKAVITSPINEAQLVENGLTIVTGAFSSSGLADTLNRTEFEARTAPLGGGALVWSGSADGLLQITVPDDSIDPGSTVYLRARHVGVSLGSGQWSDDIEITTEPVLTPSEYGAPYQGGFYAGRIKLGTDWYAIVVSPLSQQTQLYSLSTNSGPLTTQAKSIEDGWSNTNELIAYSSTQFPAAAYCYNLEYAGYSDWYLPSLMELELAYRTLKPTNSLNVTSQAPVSDLSLVGGSTVGIIGSTTENSTLFPATTIPSRTGNYTNSGGVASSPGTTSAENFQGSGVQEGFNNLTYWTSSGPSSAVTSRGPMCFINFADGSVQGATNYASGGAGTSLPYTNNTRYVRPFRRVYLRSDV